MSHWGQAFSAADAATSSSTDTGTDNCLDNYPIPLFHFMSNFCKEQVANRTHILNYIEAPATHPGRMVFEAIGRNGTVEQKFSVQ
jgi:hypothetical protein